ncbi:winged helix-turn-helix domain-containing protein [Ornithinimicrobium flavum]|uniref:winged helix-turn-helix domain-containing protein n=1 Tax=Ornithinimicrobium flavum TaxID=1288636 RepID=UPI0013053535|nr:winged helix-turn-helix domain-containing protein [Ornithinimicrobium flavum]
MSTAAGVPASSSAPSLVVVVSPCREEQARLIAGLPPDVAVLLAPTLEHAQELLHTLPSVATDPILGCTLRADERTVTFGDRYVRLTPLEFAMLRVLASEPGRVWAFPELARTVWATGYVGDGAQVRAVVKRLRRKLAEAEAPVCVETVRAAGLRLGRRTPALS